MLSNLISLDKELFLFLNGLHQPWLDDFMWYCSGFVLWLPLYCFIIYLFIIKLKKEVWILILSLALLFFLSDYISSGIIKHAVMRFRPSHDPDLEGLVFLFQKHNGDFYRGGLYGFVSSHAANTFALATFVTLFFRKNWLSIAMFSWAVLVSYSRIYLGVHFVSDIIGGMLVGIFAAFAAYFVFQKNYFFYLKKVWNA